MKILWTSVAANTNRQGVNLAIKVLQNLYPGEIRPVVPGEDLSEYDRVIVIMQDGCKQTSRYFLGALWALRHPEARVVMADWQVGDIPIGAGTLLRHDRFLFRRTNRSHCDEGRAHRDELREVLMQLHQRWPWNSLVNVWPWASYRRMRLLLPCRNLKFWDPSSHTHDLTKQLATTTTRLRWIYAALTDTGWRLDATRPVLHVGPPWGNQVTGAAVRDLYRTNGGVVAYRYPRDVDRDWWRARFLDAVQVGAVVAGHTPNLWGPYAVSARAIERIGWQTIAEDQRRWLLARLWSRDQAQDAVAAWLRKK